MFRNLQINKQRKFTLHISNLDTILKVYLTFSTTSCKAERLTLKISIEGQCCMQAELSSLLSKENGLTKNISYDMGFKKLAQRSAEERHNLINLN